MPFFGPILIILLQHLLPQPKVTTKANHSFETVQNVGKDLQGHRVQALTKAHRANYTILGSGTCLLSTSRDGDFTSLPMLNHSFSEEIFPNIHIWAQLEAVSPYPMASCLREEANLHLQPCHNCLSVILHFLKHLTNIPKRKINPIFIPELY